MEKYFQDARVMVVGGAGFVGSNLCRRLLEFGLREVLVLDNLLSAERDNLPEDPRITFVKGSVSDPDDLAGIEGQFDAVFHLATFHGNQNSMHDPIWDHENNVLTTLRLFDWLVKRAESLEQSIPKTVYASAGCTVAEKTFDTASASQEDAPVSLSLDSPYQISKVIGEFYANYYHRQHQLPVVKARFQNVYGPGEVLGAGVWRGTPATVWRNVVPTFVYKALQGEALPVENGGIATRDFIFVDDIVVGLLRCAVSGKAGETYNLASGAETTILDLARQINEITENKTEIALKPARDWDRSGKRFGATEKSRQALGFTANVTLEEGLKRTVDWTRNNLVRIDACIERHRSKL